MLQPVFVIIFVQQELYQFLIDPIEFSGSLIRNLIDFSYALDHISFELSVDRGSMINVRSWVWL